MKSRGTGKSKRKGSAKSRPPVESKRRPPSANLVAEIVDQITRKQAAGLATPGPGSSAHVCAFCLEPPVAGSAYRLVLKCGNGDPSSTDP